MDASGYYSIDGKDLWTVFGMFVESGTADFLKYAPRKDSITHDWKDSNGIDIDTAQNFFKERTISLRIAMIVNSETEFWEKYNYFIAQMMLPGSRRIEVNELGERSFYCVYKECSTFDRFTRIKNSNKIGIKFTLNLTEPNPGLENDTVFIIDEDGRFLVT